MRSSPKTRILRIGAAMSGAARSASICRSMCNCQTPSSPRPWWWRRILRHVNACNRASKPCLRNNSPPPFRAWRRWNLARRLAGLFNTACWARRLKAFAVSPRNSRRWSRPVAGCAAQASTGSNPRGNCALKWIRTRRASLGFLPRRLLPP